MHIESHNNVRRNNANIRSLFGYADVAPTQALMKGEDKEEEDEMEDEKDEDEKGDKPKDSLDVRVGTMKKEKLKAEPMSTLKVPAEGMLAK